MLINGNEMKLDAANMEKNLGIKFDKRLVFEFQEKKQKSQLYVWYA